MLGIILISLFLKIHNGEATTIQVETTLGIIKGTQMETRLGDHFWAFRGIRYAEPPIGELRFQNPQPVKEWKPEVYDATKDGPICPQETVNLTYLSEDCLRLNVYTKDTKALKPVIVYLHPGGFYAVGSISTWAGPENFMDRDIVFVTLNYRLGSLGFLATGTSDAAGNMGLKDQVIALRWIRKHIQQFGGDPNSVTLFGYSAGSFSIGLHMMSPMSRGLFHRGIMMSASPLGQFKYKNNQLDLAEKQARLLNCPVKPIKDMVKCLKTKPMMSFVNTTRAMFEFEWNPVLNWLPVIECENSGQERYLVEDPYTTMSRGDIYKVPIITGITEYEFYYLGYYTLRNETQRERFNQNFAKYTPIYFLYERDTPKSLEISSAFRSFYFQNKPLKFPQSLKPFGELYGDGLIGFEYYRFLTFLQIHQVPVYTYLFTYKGRYSHFVNPDTNQTLGAMHHDELLYLFNVPVMTPMFRKTDPENDTIERLTRMWFEFAKKSDPNNPSDDYLKNLQWPHYDSQKKQYLAIGQNLNVKSNGFFQERFQLWHNLFPIPNGVKKGWDAEFYLITNIKAIRVSGPLASHLPSSK